jgi:hypothetical protein
MKVRQGTPVTPKPYVAASAAGSNSLCQFFINRPIVAIVIAILMIIAGIVSMFSLPTAQFANTADPQIQVVGN